MLRLPVALAVLAALTTAALTAAAPAAQVVPDSVAVEAVPEAAPAPRPAPRPAARPAARPRPPSGTGARRLSGPRVGFTVLSARNVEDINETFGESTYDPLTQMYSREEIISTAFPVVTQFGWQLERQMFQSQSGLTALAETVLLVGGLERGIALPSASFVVGVRTPGGLEVGLGPNISATGVGYALTVGIANNVGEVSLPVNAAVVLGRDGVRASLLVGFTFSDERY